MEKKGLCSTCVNDKECTFTRKFPVLQCEEFTDYEPKPTKIEKTKQEKENGKTVSDLTNLTYSK